MEAVAGRRGRGHGGGGSGRENGEMKRNLADEKEIRRKDEGEDERRNEGGMDEPCVNTV